MLSASASVSSLANLKDVIFIALLLLHTKSGVDFALSKWCVFIRLRNWLR